MILALFFIASTTWWIDFSDEPKKSDIMVVLAGSDFNRPLFAAELYAQGYAPEIWLCRPIGSPGTKMLDSMGIHISPEEEINKAVLLKGKVPPDHIHFYGRELQSTADEALTLRKSLLRQPKDILVVTSRTHARRSKMTFRHYFPDSTIRVTATPYGEFNRRWWKERDMAIAAIIEPIKTIYFLLGGRFLANDNYLKE